jgi:hypothetical protein
MKAWVLFVSAVTIGNLALPCFARVPDYGARRYTEVGHERGHEHGIDRRGGPGWGGVAAAGIIGAIAGLALGSHEAVAPVPVGPPVVGTVVPALPGDCPTVPTYNGGVLFNCGGIYYQPYYEGTELFYQVVPGP